MKLEPNRIHILDGGVSTLLEQYVGHFPVRELWSSSLLWKRTGANSNKNEEDSQKHFQTLSQAHKEWINEGQCDIISTVTYQCHFETKHWPPGMTNETMNQIMDNGVRIAREAVQQAKLHDPTISREIKVVASSGCFGAILSNGAEYTGNYGEDTTMEVLQQFHAAKLRKYQECHVAVAIETVPSALECRALAALLGEEANCFDVAWISLACKSESELNDGSAVRDSIEILHHSLPSFIGLGFNCCHAKLLPGLVAQLLSVVRNGPVRPIVLYPNSGEIWESETESWKEGSHISDHDFLRSLEKCVQLVRDAYRSNGSESTTTTPPIVIGGCCRTTPFEIRSLASRFKLD